MHGHNQRTDRPATVGSKILDGLREFADALKRGESITERFRCRTIVRPRPPATSRRSPAAVHSFTLILGSDTQFTDDVAEQICLEVGDDTLFGTCNGAAHIDFEREGESFRDVVLSAIADVERIGLRVERVEPASAAELATDSVGGAP